MVRGWPLHVGTVPEAVTIVATASPTRGNDAVDWKLELVAVPVTDVDRAKAFYTDQVGFVADHDHRVSDDMRFVQLTPPGSACSIAIGRRDRGLGARIGAGPAARRPRRRRARTPSWWCGAWR